MVSYHSETKRLTRSWFVCYGSNLRECIIKARQARQDAVSQLLFLFVFKLSANPRISEDIVNLVGELVGTAAVTLLSNGELQKYVRIIQT